MSLSCCHLAGACIITCRIWGGEQTLPTRYRVLTSAVEYLGKPYDKDRHKDEKLKWSRQGAKILHVALINHLIHINMLTCSLLRAQYLLIETPNKKKVIQGKLKYLIIQIKRKRINK